MLGVRHSRSRGTGDGTRDTRIVPSGSSQIFKFSGAEPGSEFVTLIGPLQVQPMVLVEREGAAVRPDDPGLWRGMKDGLLGTRGMVGGRRKRRFQKVRSSSIVIGVCHHDR